MHHHNVNLSSLLKRRFDGQWRNPKRANEVPRRIHISLNGGLCMNIQVSRRRFLQLAGAGAAATTSIAAFGLGEVEAQIVSHVRNFKLSRATQVRNTCTYCSVACGIILYSRGDLKKGETAEIFHIEGDAEHPTNRGTLCPKGAALLETVHSKTRTLYPQVRKPRSDTFERISWNEALDRIARLMKDDRDRNLVEKNAEGTTVNRWTTTGFLAASATTNETAWATYKVVRSTGMVAFDNQARV
jgi:formate dehydrogenase major subunit